MYVGFLVLLYIVYRVKNLKIQVPLDVSKPNQTTSIPLFIPDKHKDKYEYLSINIIHSHEEDAKQLSELGKDGWELTIAINDRYILKRHK
jgi:hypothetical protein